MKILSTFLQIGIVGSFELNRYYEEYEKEEIQISIYEEEVVVFAENVKLGGTFSRPKEKIYYGNFYFW